MSTQEPTNGNGNGNGVFDSMTLKDAVKLILQEINDVRRELLKDLGGRMDKLEGEMREMKKELNGKIDGLRMEVHQNQTTFIKNHGDLEKRVTLLEAGRNQ